VLLQLPVLLEADLLGEQVELGQELGLELAEVERPLAALVAAATAPAPVVLTLVLRLAAVGLTLLDGHLLRAVLGGGFALRGGLHGPVRGVEIGRASWRGGGGG